MRIYSTAHGINFEYNPDELCATFDDTNLLSTHAYSPEFFGKLVDPKIPPEKLGQEMPETENVAPWSLEDLGYMNDAPHVHADGRIDGQLQPPHYYAYTPSHTNSWEDGLQEIEDFDWSVDTEDGRDAGELISKIQVKEDVQAAAGADTLGLIHHDRDLERTNSPTTRSEDRTQVMEGLPPESGIETIALSASIKHVGLNPSVVDGQHVEAEEVKVVEISIVAETGCSETGPRMEGDVAAERETVTMPGLTAYQGGHVADEINVETEPDTGLVDNYWIKRSSVTSAPASSCHDGHFMHEPGLEIPPKVVNAPEVPMTKMTAIGSGLLVEPRPCNSRDGSAATCSVLETPDQLWTQKDEPKARDQLQNYSAVQVQLAIDSLRSPSGVFLKAPALQSHSEARWISYAPEVGSEHTDCDEPTSSELIENDPTGPKSAGVLSYAEEKVDGRWQAQLQDAADEVSSNGLSDLLPPGYRGHKDSSPEPHAKTVNNELSVPAHSPLVVPSSQQQLDKSASLPPLPFAPQGHAARHEGWEAPPLEASATKENASATQLAYRFSQPSTPFSAQPVNAQAEDQVAVSDLGNSKSTVVMFSDDLAESKSPSHDQDTFGDLGCSRSPGSPLPSTSPLGSPTSASARSTQTIHPRKRSNPSKETKNVSETESDDPPKKKARKNASVMSRDNIREKLSKALVAMMSNFEPLPAKNTRSAIESKKEVVHVNGADKDSSAEVSNGGTSKLGHSAQGERTGTSQQAPITDETKNMIPGSDTGMRQPEHENNDADMEERYSDVEVPVTPTKHFSTASNVSSTPRSRPKVSNRELQGLSPTKYRERLSKAKWDTAPISRELSKQGTPDKLSDSSTFVEGSGVTSSTLEMAELTVAKPKAIPAKTKKHENSQAQALAPMKALAACPTKKQKTETAEGADEGVLPGSKIDSAKSAPLPGLASLPKERFTNAQRETRSKNNFDRKVDVTGAVEDSPIVTIGNSDVEDLSSGIREHENVKDLLDEDDEDFKDAQETIEASEEDEETDDDYFNTPDRVSKKPKLKNESLMLGTQSVSQSKSRTSIPAPTTNKYGFKPSPKGPQTPRTRTGRKTTAVSKPAPPSATAPKAKVPAKRKAKTVPSDAATEGEEDNRERQVPSAVLPKAPPKSKGKDKKSLEPTDQPSVRKTRHAAAMEDESRHAREEKEKALKEKVRAEAKAKLRSKV